MVASIWRLNIHEEQEENIIFSELLLKLLKNFVELWFVQVVYIPNGGLDFIENTKQKNEEVTQVASDGNMVLAIFMVLSDFIV